MVDDWFAEPTPQPTLNELYDRRLRAWGWLRGNRCAWEPRLAFSSLMEDYYLPALQRELNRDLSRMFYGSPPWQEEPERPASQDYDGKINVVLTKLPSEDSRWRRWRRVT